MNKYVDNDSDILAYIFFIWLIFPFKVVSQNQANIQDLWKHFALPSPSVPRFFVGEKIEEGLPRPLAPSIILSPFTIHREYYGGDILVDPPQA